MLIECHKIIEAPLAWSSLRKTLGCCDARPYACRKGQSGYGSPSGCRSGDKLYLAAGQGLHRTGRYPLFESMEVHGIIVERRLSDLLHFVGPVMLFNPQALRQGRL